MTPFRGLSELWPVCPQLDSHVLAPRPVPLPSHTSTHRLLCYPAALQTVRLRAELRRVTATRCVGPRRLLAELGRHCSLCGTPESFPSCVQVLFVHLL